jgi:hypothetical protein
VGTHDVLSERRTRGIAIEPAPVKALLGEGARLTSIE